jgi:crotonobetainyl-CoA:carnitine CoA-transferase CaiB-like acyl-CoA transferase
MLADLGARVIRLEQRDGDPIRFQVAPEIGGVKVTQGKESIAVDITSPEGREIAMELVRRADVVLRSFRGGVAERLGYDDAALLAVNPDLVYLNAPGFGVGGPYGHRPAYAPVIGAGSGFARRNAGIDMPERPDLTLDEVKVWSQAGGAGVAHADGFAALGVGAALALGILAKERGAGGQSMLTTMLATLVHVIADDMIEYEGRSAAVTVTPDRRGFNALYRFYETADRWVILAAPSAREWAALVSVVEGGLGEDPRFATADDRRANDAALTAVLRELLRARPATAWEAVLGAVDVACVPVVEGDWAGVVMREGGVADQLGMVSEVDHPFFGRHLRMSPLATLSRSGGRIGAGCSIGQHTDAILRELGYDDARIHALRAAGIVGPVG